jgi:hypothetical protein
MACLVFKVVSAGNAIASQTTDETSSSARLRRRWSATKRVTFSEMKIHVGPAPIRRPPKAILAATSPDPNFITADPSSASV